MKTFKLSHIVKTLTMALVSTTLLSISVPSFSKNEGLNCTLLTVTEMKKALETNKLTSE